MPTICKACDIIANGMINIFSHPNELDLMFKFVSGIEVRFLNIFFLKKYNFFGFVFEIGDRR